MNYKIVNGILVFPKDDDFEILKKDFFVVNGLVKFNSNILPDKIIDAAGRIILPGLVNAHNHIYSTLSKGLPVKGAFGNFDGILKNLWWKLDSVLSRKDVELSTIISIKEAFENGVTTMFDHHISMKFIENSLVTMADLFNQYKMKGGLSFEITNRYGEDNFKKMVDENINFYHKHSDVKAFLGMHALLTLDYDNLKYISQKIPDDMPIHIHIAECKEDEITAQKKYGKSIIEILNDFSLLKDNSILVHNSNISQKEIDILKDKKIFLVQAIDSNMNNAQNAANIHNLIKNGLEVTIGSDGMTSNILRLFKDSFLFTKYQNQNPDIGFDEMKKMFLTSFKLKEIYGFPMGLDRDEQADFVITNYTPYTPFTKDNFMGHFIYGITETTAKYVFSSGNMVLDNGNLTNIDVKQIALVADKVSQKLFEKFSNI